MDLAIIIIYTLALLVIFFYSISELQLLLNYLKAKKSIDSAEKFDLKNSSQIPKVTIQLPLYNEMYVVERLLRNIAKIDYPKDKLEIQVLDDSTDESILKTTEIIEEIREGGIDIQHIRRENRSGFKAGALKALLHGDLWHGNTALTVSGPIIFDPATYWGDRRQEHALDTSRHRCHHRRT